MPDPVKVRGLIIFDETMFAVEGDEDQVGEFEESIKRYLAE